MIMRAITAIVMLALIIVPALADRPVTEAERAKLVEAITAAGCSGGKMAVDESDKEFEVDDAVCDGRKHDLKFNFDFSLKSKKVDN